MFDRLYRLTIHHTALPNRTLVITGDSAKPSLGLDFSCAVNRSGAFSSGRISIFGLTYQHINLLSSIRRYNYAKNASEHNMATLSVGWRDLDSGIVSKMTVIAHGPIMEAIPGPLPDRSLTMTLFTGMKRDVVLAADEQFIDGKFNAISQKANTANGVEFAKWAAAAAKELNEASMKLTPAEQNFWISMEGDFSGWKFTGLALPSTVEKFVDIVRNRGAVVKEECIGESSAMVDNADPSSDETAKIKTHYRIYDKAQAFTEEILISQKTDMIGIPRSIPMGASVDVVLKDVISPGSIVSLYSEKFPNLNSDALVYTGGGLYTVMSTEFQGSFHGDQWLQRLTLNRGSLLKK